MAEGADIPNRIYESFVDSLPDLRGRIYAITGTTSGTGYHAAAAAVARGAAAVLLLNRPSDRATASFAQLKAMATGGTTAVVAVDCDLQSFASVRAAAATVVDFAATTGVAGGGGGLDGVVCNAGVMGLPDTRTDDGYEVQMQTNHLSHFLLCRLLMPALARAAARRGEARVVQHSSGARGRHLASDGEGKLEPRYFARSAPGTLGGDGLGACFDRYHQTKLANACFAMALHDRLARAGSRVKSLCAEPGVAATRLGANLGAGHAAAGSEHGGAFAASSSGMYVPQSAADGACPLIAAAFGAGADSGDFFMPGERRERTVKGAPVKCVTRGTPTPTARWMRRAWDNEALTMDPANRAVLWASSEAAVGKWGGGGGGGGAETRSGGAHGARGGAHGGGGGAALAALFAAERTYRAGPADLDAYGCVPAHLALRWLQDLRMDCPGFGALLRAGTAEAAREGKGRQRVVVRAQVLRWAHPDAMLGHRSYHGKEHGGDGGGGGRRGSAVHATQALGRVGRSSIELVYTLRRAGDGDGDGGGDGAPVARALVVMVVVGGDGRPVARVAVPRAAQPFDAAAHNAAQPNHFNLRALLRAMLPKPGSPQRDRAAVTDGTPRPPFVYRARVRPSDEDANMHVNHASYARLFGDARVACVTAARGAAGGRRVPLYAGGDAVAPAAAVAVSYAAEARFGDALAVRVDRRGDGGHGGGHGGGDDCDDCRCTMAVVAPTAADTDRSKGGARDAAGAGSGARVVARGRILAAGPLRRLERQLEDEAAVTTRSRL